MSLARFAFQACSYNHSDISPFRINHLRILKRAESDLCPGAWSPDYRFGRDCIQFDGSTGVVVGVIERRHVVSL
jgi:hypothetical protein